MLIIIRLSDLVVYVQDLSLAMVDVMYSCFHADRK